MKRTVFYLTVVACLLSFLCIDALAQNPGGNQKKESEFVEEYVLPVRIMKTEAPRPR